MKNIFAIFVIVCLVFIIASLGFIMASFLETPSLYLFAREPIPAPAAVARPSAQNESNSAANAQPGKQVTPLYGNRTKIFTTLPAHVRPDVDWRDVLTPWLRVANPKYSQTFEEILIRDHFQDKKGGFFVDVGCAGPIRDSTTYYLEKNLHWKGIGIDVNNLFAPMWKKIRPTSKFINMAIYDTDGEVLTMYIAGQIWSLEQEMTEQWLRPGINMREIDVTTITLNTLLEENGVDKIDFLSMDIEGAEMGALRGFDIQKYRPDLLCIESGNVEPVDEYMERNGYERIKKYRAADKINVYYRPKPRTGALEEPTLAPAVDAQPNSASETSPENSFDDSEQKMDSTNQHTAEVTGNP